ncbi:rhodanese-like domain-containing protein [Nocardioides pantholopis]|uniref:rhodanese-like domain-containing protein n=1 Tax=Nocardioides pantholopis TaxID=2483798 RepID=UPI000F080D26|nr:rhodanese-like domain-containing protein [Nocardioides pantholopis]
MREIDIDQLATKIDRAAVVDVREPAEYAEGHVPGAVNIPMGRLTDRLGELDRDRPVYVVCASGNRSSAMVDVLTAAGFDAVNVAGGTSAWVRSGRPVER